MNRTVRAICLIVVAVTAGGGCKRRDAHFVSIGTGSVTGIYYPTGGAISQMINKKFKQYRIKATVESTSGSVYNVNAVLQGDLDFGMVQSDRQYQAYCGLAEWEDKGPQKNLRSVFSVHPESITLVASDRSGVKAVQDLWGKRVNLGNIGSGHLQNSRDVVAAAGLTEGTFAAEHVRALEAPGLLQDGRIDAFFYTVGHPNSTIEEATFGRLRVRLIPIEGQVARRLLEEYPYYAESVIPHEYYPNALNDRDVPSIGVKTTFVTSIQIPEDVVYAMTREVFENFESFKKLHPAYRTLTKLNMLKGLSAPLHPGALRYYRQVGLDKHIDPSLIQE